MTTFRFSLLFLLFKFRHRGTIMNIQATPTQAHELDERILARQLARELTKDEVDAIAGGRMKLEDVGGTSSGIWGNLDDQG
jgi:hypothetical protein